MFFPGFGKNLFCSYICMFQGIGADGFSDFSGLWPLADDGADQAQTEPWYVRSATAGEINNDAIFFAVGDFHIAAANHHVVSVVPGFDEFG